ncbi:sulfate ABC transporter, ATP-binding protein [Leptospira inadai serovar Lyme str. 10]|uniref:Sulfate ABC transporter, ATP-binding protein n=2 Tax=Leptospira inadai serovar Lyme TaxID=293084 RepID=V6HDV9_9LEPT|nr:sulfate/molybdate ABC transporter ATP-binding protein [Leptospira inadai]EQA38157.1 sulfate ABC transporter, ATP-binding protein [Leptospira inadai serovar Lyme str. 10]PNV75163.1 sulfate ABC transporter ATP-binding protein [Leptospira inadai serovar Lyme]
MSIEIRNVSKRFGEFQALKDINLTIPEGDLVALLGPSGSGKTTLLRIIAGLEAADEGEVYFNGEKTKNRNSKDRGVGFVFQHYALFRHMTIFENIAFGLKVRPRATRPSKVEIRDRVFRLLKLVQLENFHDRFPSELSGGQRQRVALARALAIEPKYLLLDEPFGALDAKVRKELRTWLRRLHDEIHITSVFVTHDQEEALEVSDSIVILRAGKIEQIGSPDEVYNKPKNPFVFHFLGDVNLFHGRVQDGKARIGDQHVESPEHSEIQDAKAVAYVRPYDVEILRLAENGIPAEIQYIHSTGRNVRVELKRLDSGSLIESLLDQSTFRELNLLPGEKVYLRIRNAKVYVEDFSI